jgi:carboxylesterase type B
LWTTFLTKHDQAILQSPAFIPTKGNLQARDEEFKAFIAKANCSDLACLRRAPTQALMQANSFLTQHGAAAGVGFSVVVDGDFVPDLPAKLLLEGRYHKSLTSVITANNQHEVRLLLNPLLDFTTNREG